MSSVDAANTHTITIVDDRAPDSTSPPPPDAPSAHHPSQPDVPPGVDGRTSDADKMLESAAVPMGEGDSAADAAGPSNLDASQQQAIDTNGAGADDAQPWTEEETHDLKRVKVYELIGSRWVDQGTAFCFGDCNESQALLIARAEADYNHIILSTKIRPTDVYQRQQGMFCCGQAARPVSLRSSRDRYAHRVDRADRSGFRAQLPGPRGL